MNVRLESGSARFKISEEELKKLVAGEALEESIDCGEGGLIVAIVPSGSGGALSLAYSGHTLRLHAPEMVLDYLANLGRSREGIEQDSAGLKLVLQVDFRTQKRAAAQKQAV